MSQDNSGNCLVRVRAQVMSRDDSSGGWLPLGGGGLSNVSVRRRPRPSQTQGGPSQDLAHPKYDYLICGKKISDQTVVLQCTIKKDFEYNKVMPTFHHWRTGAKRFGLTFQTAADARAFDKGVRTAVEELLDGFLHGLTDSCPLTPLHELRKDVQDDDVFMTLNLPLETGGSGGAAGCGQESRSSSDSGARETAGHELPPPPPPPTSHRIHYISRTAGHDNQDSLHKDKSGSGGENYSYVHLTAVHEYIYPVVEHVPSSRKSLPPGHTASLSSPLKSSGGGHLSGGGTAPPPVCLYCHDRFSPTENVRGSCEYAPDVCRTLTDTLACIPCARCLLYHCGWEEGRDPPAHPCACPRGSASGGGRWLRLAMLSLVLPCLCVYPPLRLCHLAGMACGMCGGKHAVY